MSDITRIAAFTVTLELPRGVSRENMGDYILAAVQGWKGGFDPNNPLFDLDRDSVTVRTVYPPTRRKER